VHRVVWWALADPSRSPRYEGSRGTPPFSQSPLGDRCGASSGKTHRHPDDGFFPDTDVGGLSLLMVQAQPS
jgi:hypothetical protein